MPSYPQSVDLSQATNASRSPQAPNTQKTAGPIRDPSKTLMSALHDPFIPGSDWECIPCESKAGPETVDSQTTGSIVDAAAFNNTAGHAQSGLSKTNVDAFNALDSGLVSNAHKASGFPTSYVNADVASTADAAVPPQQSEDKPPGSPGNIPYDDLMLVGSWAQENQ